MTEDKKGDKGIFFRKIQETMSSQSETINKIQANVESLGLTNINIPRTGVVLNNKVVEIYRRFQEAGVPLFIDDGNIETSILGEAILKDLVDKLEQSTQRLLAYSQRIEDLGEKRNAKVQALQNVNPLMRIWLRIRAAFVPIRTSDFSVTEEERSSLDSSLQEYKDIDNQIWNYNLEDNLIFALVKKIAGPVKFGDYDINHSYQAIGVPALLEACVMPDLKKLGLEHLVPRLQEALIEEYKKDLPDPQIFPVKPEDMYLYVPDFSRKSDEIAQETVADSTLASIMKKAERGGIGVEAFQAVDGTVSALQREAAIGEIGREVLHTYTIDETTEKKPDELEH